MTSRERFEAWYDAQKNGRLEPFNVWQAAERDMLERAIAQFNKPLEEYIGINIQFALKELLNEKH